MAERLPCKFEGLAIPSEKARRVSGGDFTNIGEIDTKRRRSGAKRRELCGRDDGEDLIIVTAGENRLDERSVVAQRGRSRGRQRHPRGVNPRGHAGRSAKLGEI